MIFGEKFNDVGSESENSSNIEKIQQQDPSLSFSAIYFLRNRIFPPSSTDASSQNFDLSTVTSPSLPPLESIFPIAKFQARNSPTISSSSTASAITKSATTFCPYPFNNSLLTKRPRGEKRPIPENQKDEKYFERRKRNNEAAKKSRDARKLREDRIALRAALLEQENSILRAQSIALREEVFTLRQILCNSRTITPNIASTQA